VVLAGDVCYSREMARRVFAFLNRAGRTGARVLVGDPGRAYLPRTGLRAVATYDVPVPRTLEDVDVKTTTVWRLAACGTRNSRPRDGAGDDRLEGRHVAL
jgi:predicted nicotinamide N-methyase